MSIFTLPFAMISSTFGYSYSVQKFSPSGSNLDRTSFMSRLFVSYPKADVERKIITPFFESPVGVNEIVINENHEICKLMPRDSWALVR